MKTRRSKQPVDTMQATNAAEKTSLDAFMPPLYPGSGNPSNPPDPRPPKPGSNRPTLRGFSSDTLQGSFPLLQVWVFRKRPNHPKED